MKLRNIAALVAVAIAAACATYTTIDSPLPGNDVYGVTYCRGNEPVVWINANVFGTDDARGTINHELKHAEQVLRFGSCNAWSYHLTTHGALIEAEAFCEEVKVDILPPRMLSRDSAISKYAGWLVEGYQYKLSRDSAVKLMRRFC